MFHGVLELGCERFDETFPDIVVVIIDWVEAVKLDSHVVGPSINSWSLNICESDGHLSEG